MNLARTLRAFAAIFSLGVGIAAPADAQISAFFTPGNSCVAGTAQPVDVSYVPGGGPVTVSLCMKSDAPAALTCGFTAVLESASAAENGLFTVTGVSRTGSPFQEANSSVAPLPLSIVTSPVTVADFGAIVSSTPLIPAAGASAILLATFTITPSASATNSSYAIKLNSVSAAAVDSATPNNNCGTIDIPSDAPLSGTFNMKRSLTPAFTSASATTFSSATTNSFTVTAVGVPTPTLSLTGSLPSGVSFNAATGVLSSTAGVAVGTYNITFNATNGGPTVSQPFTLTVGAAAGQTITFNNPPGQQVFSSTPITVSATASSGLPVTFSTGSPQFCLVSGNQVTMVALGSCTIIASQAGNGTTISPATASISFNITGTAPSAPQSVTATPGDSQVTVAFAPPASNGGSAVLSYTVTCIAAAGPTNSATSATSPITVTGLTNGNLYTCSVTAINAQGPGPSASATATPTAGALTLIGVQSRKVHGSAGSFDIAIDPVPAIGGSISVEPRAQIVGGVASHTIVFQFSGPVTVAGSATTTAGTAAAPTINGNEVIVVLSGIADKQRVTVGLNGVNTTVNASASIGFLVGDVNGSRNVDTLDISPIRARSGQSIITTTNFKFDINASGAIDTNDVSAVRARSGVGI